MLFVSCVVLHNFFFGAVLFRRFLSGFLVLVTAFLKVLYDFLSLLLPGAGAEKLLKFKKWFWSIVEKMSNSDRQDLVSVLVVLESTVDFKFSL